MIKLSHTIIVDKTAEKVFNFLSDIDKYYLWLSKGHKKFDLVNADLLKKGIFIKNEETAGRQYIKHRYQVVEIIKNHYLKLVSDPSIVTVLAVFKLPVKVTVEFEIEPLKVGKARVASHLTVEFKNKITEFFAKIISTEKIWQAHLVEEVENGATLIKTMY